MGLSTSVFFSDPELGLSLTCRNLKIYLAPVSNAATADGPSASWFKISEIGLPSSDPDYWGTGKLLSVQDDLLRLINEYPMRILLSEVLNVS